MSYIINRIKFLIFVLGYLSIFTQAIPLNNNINSQTLEDCQTLLDIYEHFNLKLPPYANSDNKNCCDYNARLEASADGNKPTTEWLCSNNRINTIILKEKNISTDVPWDLFQKLDNLEYLHLNDNKLIGEIRGDLREIFPNLKQLRIQNNNLSGYLPTYLPPKIDAIVFDNNQINDSIPQEWEKIDTLKDCILPNNVCKPRNSNMSCHINPNKSNEVSSCKSESEEDRSAALQKLSFNNNNNTNNNIDNNNNNNNNNNNKINEDNNNINNGNNNNNTNNGQNSNISNNEIKHKSKRSHAVLYMTLCIFLLMGFILIIISIVSHYSRIKTREKEKNIYKGTTIYDEKFNSSRTEASIFYSKTNNNTENNIFTFEENNNSISLFNCMSRRNSQTSQTTAEHKLLADSSSSDEISFLENSNPNNVHPTEMSFSVIDPAGEILEPAPALLQSPNTSYI